MENYLFFARFTKEEEGGYSIDFPGIDGAFTEGETIEECMQMAEECLSLHLYNMLEDGDVIPETPNPEEIELEKDQFIVPLKAYPDLVKYRIDMSNVKKTLTIPKWINILGEKNKINFSKVLQDAVLREVGIGKI